MGKYKCNEIENFDIWNKHEWNCTNEDGFELHNDFWNDDMSKIKLSLKATNWWNIKLWNKNDSNKNKCS